MQVEYGAEIEVYKYPVGPEPSLQAWAGQAATGWSASASAMPVPSASSPAVADDSAMRAQFDRKLIEEAQRGFETGRERGLLEGRQAERAEQAEANAAAAQQRAKKLAELIDGFAQERDRYFHAVEHEVVELALAIAARILRREAQMDPLLLTGAVRVALGQLSHSTQVRLRVPPAELDLWTEAIAHLPNLALKPTVMAGEDMRLGDCAIETELGSVDLGVRAQLGEIERGFFDRAGKGRAMTTAPAQEANP